MTSSNYHQVTVPANIWEWAQRKWGVKNPASKLREILVDAMVEDAAANSKRVSVVPNGPSPATVAAQAAQHHSQQQGQPTALHLELKRRWRDIGLAPDPSDPEYMRAREVWIVMFDSEMEALEAAEHKKHHGGRGPNGEITNMRGWLCWWFKQQRPAS